MAGVLNVFRSRSSLLLEAAQNGEVAAIDQLLTRGANVNVQDHNGWALLHHAAAKGCPQAVEALIAHGAQVDICDAEGLRPLHLAAGAGHGDVVRLLIAHGADLNAKRNRIFWDCTPLTYAAEMGQADIVLLLLCLGAKPVAEARNTGLVDDTSKNELITARDADGATVLHKAARNGDAFMARLLVANGADVHAKDAGGRTPLIPALQSGHLDAAKLLFPRSGFPDPSAFADDHFPERRKIWIDNCIS